MIRLFIILLLLVTPSIAAEGPCSRKLLATGDRHQDTVQFTMYIEMLVDDRTVTLSDLTPFTHSLESGKIINPIPHATTNKHWAFHHSEFSDLIRTGKLDLNQIKVWAAIYIAKKHGTETKKEKTKELTREKPVFIAPDGAMFYKISHEALGPAYKILKPKGRYENKSDWYDVVWPVHLLRDKRNQVLERKNDGGADKNNKLIVSVYSPARKACLKKGTATDLPTREQYAELLSHFDQKKNKHSPTLSTNGRKELLALFPDANLTGLVWTASLDPIETEARAWFFDGYTVASFDPMNLMIEYGVRCIGRIQE